MYIVAIVMLAAQTWPISALASTGETPGRYRISVITIGQGRELFSRFGHIGLLVDDHREKTQKVYNFGTYDFTNPALRFKYIKGFLIYWVSVRPLDTVVRQYRREDRQLEQRLLALAPTEAAKLAQTLAIMVQPENREYAYRHFLNNCSTRIRDLIDEAGGGAIGAVSKGVMTGRTYRDHTRQSLAGTFAGALGIDFVLGPAGDRRIDRWEEQFLPDILAENLDRAKLSDGAPLVERKTILYERRGAPLSQVAERWDPLLISGLFALLALGFVTPMALGPSLPRLTVRLAGMGLLVWGVIGGTGGSLLAYIWTATTHYDFHCNENLLCFLPTHLWLIIPAFRLILCGRLRPSAGCLITRYLLMSAGIVVAALLLKLRSDPQNNYGFMAFCLGMNVACLASLLRAKLTMLPG